MIVFQARGISKSFGDKQIFKQVNLAVNEKERVGLVGINGSGKTTLLKCLAKEIIADEGEIMVSSLTSIGYLEQLPDIEADTTVWGAVMDSFADLVEKRQLLHELEVEMSCGGPGLEKVMERYARVTEEYERANGYACENLARRILIGLGFTSQQFDQLLTTLSGGQKTRLNLGRLLALSPDVLLLDEPTNHLDISSVEWLEDFLKSYAGTVLVVSHDRMFLNQIVTRIVELNDGQLKSYNGDYSRYLKQKADEDMAWQRAYEKQQEYIRKTEDYIRRFKAGIKSKQARGRQSQLARLERIDAPRSGPAIDSWQIKMNRESGQEVLNINQVFKSFGELTVFADVNLRVQKGDKLALVGPNGCGKTTLLKMITGDIQPDKGEIRPGSRVHPGYFSQEHENLDFNHTVLEEILYNFDLTIEEARTCLAGMLFREDDVLKLVGDLSGGERGRLSLLKLVLSGANFLLLDEPTNHLDIESCQAVEKMLTAYPGTVLLVSHDRYFIDQVANRVVAVEDHNLKYYWGNYSYYHEKLLEKKTRWQEERRSITKEKNQMQQNNPEKEQQRIRRRLGKELEEIELHISELEERKGELEALLSDPGTYEDMERSRACNTEYQELTDLLAGAYARWEELTERIELPF